MDIWTPLKRQKEVKDTFVKHYSSSLAHSLSLPPEDFKKVDFENRLDVIPDTLMYNREDPYVWGQDRGKLAEYFTVYFDGVFICGFDTNTPQAKLDRDFWKGIRDAYKSQKIRFNKGLAEKLKKEQDDQIKQAKLEADKRLAALPESTPVQRMAKEVIRKVKNDRLPKKNK